MEKVRFQLFIDKDQKMLLKQLQKHYRVSAAEMIREAIRLFLEDKKKTKELPVLDRTAEQMLAVAGICKGGPANLADLHDGYLYQQQIKK